MQTYNEFADIYDKLIYEDIDYDKAAAKVLEVYGNNNPEFDDYLDLACGTGNLTVKLCKKFKNTYVVDLSEDMLEKAFEKFKKEKVKAKIICQDMSELELNHKFNLITCMLDSTNYITEDEDLRSYFKNVCRHLKDDGIFIFDINSYYKLSEILGNNIYTYSTDDIFYTWENSFENNIAEMFLTFFVKNNEDLYERFEEEHEERAYTESEIESALKEAGLKVIEKYEGYSNKKVNPESERILYITKKA